MRPFRKTRVLETLCLRQTPFRILILSCRQDRKAIILSFRQDKDNLFRSTNVDKQRKYNNSTERIIQTIHPKTFTAPDSAK